MPDDVFGKLGNVSEKKEAYACMYATKALGFLEDAHQQVVSIINRGAGRLLGMAPEAQAKLLSDMREASYWCSRATSPYDRKLVRRGQASYRKKDPSAN